MHPSSILNEQIEISTSQIMIKVEHPQSQQVSKDQLNERTQGTQRYQIASLSLLKAQNMLPSMVTLFLKLTGPAAELLPEGGIEPISNLMKWKATQNH
ncbi:hypothetical protein O181_021358 [Austropuccinia psidii MF-1]|uniref:Uncharacterized protein n=1 Tax=Austropuccinia psidii MF-1 TaxID=1389203 RepID=A0A9Q3GVD2_9BASI|nr:hypothetical protein [Austropuccinia psidii MF-1]